MEEIGTCANVSRATVFNYFARKEDLVIAWFDVQRESIAGVLVAGTARPDSTSSRLERAFVALARIYEEDPRTGRAMVHSWLRAGGTLLTPDSGTIRLFADTIRRGRVQGDVPSRVDPDRAGALLFDAYIGELQRWVNRASSQRGLEDGMLSILELVLGGIATPDSESG
jgi:AcrR family transcriptional regulator